MSDVFEGLWPGISAALRCLKQACGYKIVAQLLQRVESSTMIDGVCGRIVAEYPDVRFLTIHDAILTPNSYVPLVRQVMVSEFARYGVSVTIHEELSSLCP